MTSLPAPRYRARGAFALLPRFSWTIRGRIFLAFLVSSLITAALGITATLAIRTAGVLVDKTYDHSLMSINHARAAAADFAGIQAAAARLRTASPEEARTLESRIEELVRAFDEDLEVAVERSQSERATGEAVAAKVAVTQWLDARHRFGLRLNPDAKPAWDVLDAHAAAAEQHLDLMINFTAGDGFTYRQAARATVAQDIKLSLAATLLAIALSAAVALLLTRRIVRPVADASTVATRIAAGELTVEVPRGGADEFGALLRAMAVMRDNIEAMMREEVSRRRSAQALLADAVQGSNEGIIVADAAGRIVLANDRAVGLLNLPEPETASGRHVDAGGSVIARALLALPGNDTAATETQVADGRWLRVSRSPTRDGGFVAVCSDVSLLRAQGEHLRQSNLRLDAALSNMSQGLCLYDADNRLLVHNRRFCDMFGIEAGLLREGLHVNEVVALVARASRYQDLRALELLTRQPGALDRQDAAYAGAALCRTVRAGCVLSVEQQPTADGGWIATYEDVTQRYEAEERIITMARRDALTGLANRTVFGERLEEATAQLALGGSFATLCLDLDRFKEVNDTLGHPVGDRLLRSVADRLQRCLRDGDLIARLGGDEFAVVQVTADARRDAVTLAERLIAAFDQPFALDGHTVTVGVSIGIAMAPEHGSAPETLLKSADLALYRAKGEGRGNWCFFEPEMDLELRNRRALEIDLHDAVEAGEFELAYQPIVDLAAHRIASCEALLRWRHPTRGMVSPAEFIPLAEETGLIVPIGEWVLHRACQEARTWPSEIAVAVNISAVQFKHAALVRTVTDALKASGLPARRLELEITESVLLTDNVATLATLHALKCLGVRVAMDDFGTGYSSLNYLQSFPFDKIKIDQSFIRKLDASESSGLIIRSVVGLGRSLGMRTTAEGIETQAQLDRLRLEGCDEGQGFLFSRPVPSSHIDALFTALRRRAA